MLGGGGELSLTSLCLQQPEDWYSVKLTELREVGFPYGVSKIELADLLEEAYPEYQWEKVHLLKGRLAQQKRLERAVKDLFPVSYSLSLSCSLISSFKARENII